MLAHRVDQVSLEVEQQDIRVSAFLAEPGMKLLVNFAVLASVLGKVELFFFVRGKGAAAGICFLKLLRLFFAEPGLGCGKLHAL